MKNRYVPVALATGLLWPFASFALLWAVEEFLDLPGPLHVILSLLVPVAAGLWLARRPTLPMDATWRWLPVFVPLLATILFTIPLSRTAGLFSLTMALFLLLLLPTISLYMAAFALGCRKKPCAARKRGLVRIGACLGAVLAGAGLNAAILQIDTFYTRDLAEIGHGVDKSEWMPFVEGNRLATPDVPPTLRIAANHPRLDGAIAALPVYGAAAQALYESLETDPGRRYDDEDTPHIDDVVDCFNTTHALGRLKNDMVDIFFGAPPSAEQLAELKAAGLSPQITPFAREAFVFIAHRDNPVHSLTLDQIRDIYGKKIVNWQGVGGPDAKILAFQRPEGSGSQSAMLALVMKDRRPASPLREEYMEGMGGMVRAVADYRNRMNSLGYSFRWYASEQFPADDVKFLAVDGIAPDAETIRSGSYPLTTRLVAVTCRPLSPESQALLDWLTGPEGQALIAKTGYAPLR